MSKHHPDCAQQDGLPLLNCPVAWPLPRQRRAFPEMKRPGNPGTGLSGANTSLGGDVSFFSLPAPQTQASNLAEVFQ